MEGMEVLLSLASQGGSVGVRELARQSGMTVSRVQRYLATLAYLGMAAQDMDRRYRVGPGMHVLSALSLSSSGLASRAMAVLPKLQNLELIVALGVLWKQTVSYLYFSTPQQDPIQALGRVSGFPARLSSIGMIMLSGMEDAQVLSLFPDEGGELLPELMLVRKRGYALIKNPAGTASLAVGVGNPAIAALALSGDLSLHRLDELLRQLKEAAGQLIPSD